MASGAGANESAGHSDDERTEDELEVRRPTGEYAGRDSFLL
jgi:hypothetical protein